MTAYLLTDHILNLVAPAAFMALLLVLLGWILSGFSKQKGALRHGFWSEAAIIFILNMGVLLAGLLVFGNDGKMATYAALVVSAAVCQWLLRHGWKA